MDSSFGSINSGTRNVRDLASMGSKFPALAVQTPETYLICGLRGQIIPPYDPDP